MTREGTCAAASRTESCIDGRTTHKPNQSSKTSPSCEHQMLEWLQRGEAEVATALPRIWAALGQLSPQGELQQGVKIPPLLPALRVLISSGEGLPWATARVISERLAAPTCRVINLYGSTETTGDATVFEIKDFDASGTLVPSGKPIAGASVIIVREESKAVYGLCPRGEEGQVAVGGAVLAGGRLGAMSQVEPLPLVSIADEKAGKTNLQEMPLSGARYYLMGDMGVLDSSGTLQLLGRNSQFVKLSGRLGVSLV